MLSKNIEACFNWEYFNRTLVLNRKSITQSDKKTEVTM